VPPYSGVLNSTTSPGRTNSSRVVAIAAMPLTNAAHPSASSHSASRSSKISMLGWLIRV
jgi:hypothetical protein